MIIPCLLFFITSLPSVILSAPTTGSTLQTVSFVPTSEKSTQTSSKTPRTPRHIRGFFPHHGTSGAISDYFSFTLTSPEDPDIELWTKTTRPLSSDLHFDIYDNGHVTPDFSDGLKYPDPYLLVGPEAKRAASYLYSRMLFFGDIPHQRAIEHNQDMRRRNGLAGNRLGSLNPRSPWSRTGRFEHRYFGRVTNSYQGYG